MKESGSRQVLVTGAAGFIGSYVTSRLKADGDVVVGIGQTISGADEDFLTDLTEVLEPPVPTGDCLIHLAAHSGGIQAQGEESLYRDNIKMTATALEIARRAGVERVVLASSSVVYRDKPSWAPITEQDPTLTPALDQVTPYAWSKLTTEVLGQWFAEREGVTVVSARLATVYGPGGSFDPALSNVVHALVDRSLNSPRDSAVSVWGTGRPMRSFIFVEDAASAIVLLSRVISPKTIYNVASREQTSIGELGERVLQVTGRNQRTRFEPFRLDGPVFRCLDTTLLEGAGFQAEWGLNEGLKATVERRLTEIPAS